MTPLTEREQQIVELVSQGYAHKETAKALNLKLDTLKHHLTAIYDKTGMTGRTELAIWALNFKRHAEGYRQGFEDGKVAGKIGK